MSEKHGVTVVVVAYNSATHLATCIAAIRDACREHELEVIVVDNDSPDGTRLALATIDADVRLVEMRRNAGFAGACNAGVAVATGGYICFVNPDARPRPGAIDALVAAAHRRPDHLLYAGKVVTVAGVLDDGCCSALPTLWEYACFATGLSTAFPRSRWFDPAALGSWDRGDERVVPAVSGAFLLTRRGDFLSVGAFDERYFMYSEDIDLSSRAGAAGLPPLFVPDAVAVHDGGGSSTSGAKTTMVLRGKVTYLRAHWTPRRRALAVGLLHVGTCSRAAGALVAGRGGKWREAWSERRIWRQGW